MNLHRTSPKVLFTFGILAVAALLAIVFAPDAVTGAQGGSDWQSIAAERGLTEDPPWLPLHVLELHPYLVGQVVALHIHACAIDPEVDVRMDVITG